MQAGEGRLSVLAEREIFVRPQALEPGADGDLMAALGERDAVFIGEEIAGDAEIAAVIAAGETQLRGGIGGGAAADHDRADRETAKKAGRLAAGVPGVGSPVKK